MGLGLQVLQPGVRVRVGVGVRVRIWAFLASGEVSRSSTLGFDWRIGLRDGGQSLEMRLGRWRWGGDEGEGEGLFCFRHSSSSAAECSRLREGLARGWKVGFGSGLSLQLSHSSRQGLGHQGLQTCRSICAGPGKAPRPGRCRASGRAVGGERRRAAGAGRCRGGRSGTGCAGGGGCGGTERPGWGSV